MPEPGQHVDRYVLEGKLGEGATATVWLARDEQLGARFALKILEVRSRQIRDRMLQEGRLQSGLLHDHVVRVEQVLEVDKRPGLLMEYIEGPTLERWLASYRPTLDEALTVFRGICAGVAAAHALGLVHRDLKPANVMMAISGSRVVPRVCDFGLAKSLEEPGTGHTRMGRMLGSPAWMSPEQVEDASSVDRRTDLWSLGCILYRMVCGVQAFDGDDIQDVVDRIDRGDFRSSRELCPDLPERVHAALEATLQVDRRRRASDVASLVAWLDGSADDIVADDPPEPCGPVLSELTSWLALDSPGGAAARSGADDLLARLPKASRKKRSLPPIPIADAPARIEEPASPPPVPLPAGGAGAVRGAQWAGAVAVSLLALLVATLLAAVIVAQPAPLQLLHRPQAPRHLSGPR